MDGMVWYGFNDTERQYWDKNESVMMFTSICSQAQIYSNITTIRKACIYNLSTFYNNIYTIHTDTWFPVFLLFFLRLQYVQG